jgi:NAD(P)-dependent dehydrogenase (short-subunit alcohol dehydrogenase family)
LSAEVAEVDALDEQEVNHHLEKTFEKTGRIDISFNAIGIPLQGIEGSPLLELPTERFLLPVSTYTKLHFITAKAAARFMIRRKSGVILFRLAAPLMGGMAPAWASMEALSRNLSMELASSGIRTVCIRTTGLPETETITVSYGLPGADFQVPPFLTILGRRSLIGWPAGTSIDSQDTLSFSVLV